MPPQTESPRHNDTEEDTKEDTKDDTREDTKEDTREDTKEDTDKHSDNDSKKDSDNDSGITKFTPLMPCSIRVKKQNGKSRVPADKHNPDDEPPARASKQRINCIFNIVIGSNKHYEEEKKAKVEKLSSESIRKLKSYFTRIEIGKISSKSSIIV